MYHIKIIIIILNLLLAGNPEKLVRIPDNIDSLLIKRSKINRGTSTTIFIDKDGVKLKYHAYNIRSLLHEEKTLTKNLSKREMEEQRLPRYDKILINMINMLNILNLPELTYSKSKNDYPILNSYDVQFLIRLKFNKKTITREKTFYDFRSSVSDSKDSSVYRAYMLDNFIDRLFIEVFGKEYIEE